QRDHERRSNPMIRTGDTLHNPATGELMQFLKTSADTNGEYVYIEVVVEPNGTVAAAHLHPYQTERFEIVSGEVAFEAGKREFVAKAGEIGRASCRERGEMAGGGRSLEQKRKAKATTPITSRYGQRQGYTS